MSVNFYYPCFSIRKSVCRDASKIGVDVETKGMITSFTLTVCPSEDVEFFYFGSHITKNLGSRKPPPDSIQAGRYTFGGIHSATLRILTFTAFYEVGYLNHFIHFQSLLSLVP